MLDAGAFRWEASLHHLQPGERQGDTAGFVACEISRRLLSTHIAYAVKKTWFQRCWHNLAAGSSFSSQG